MTIDRARVEAACRAFYSWWDNPSVPNEMRASCFPDISRALAAADALAPPPVPEGVRDARFQFELKRHKIVGLLTDLKIAFDAVAVTPAPPADTGDGAARWRVGRRVPINIYRDDVPAAQFQRPEWAAEAVAALNNIPAPPADTTAMRRLEQVLDDERIAAHGLEAERDTLTRRVRELEEALRALLLVQDQMDTTGCMPADKGIAQGRARALLASPGSPADTGDGAERDALTRRDPLEAEVERLNAAVDMIAAERQAWRTRARTAERERDEARRGDYSALEVGGYARRAQIAEEEATAAEKEVERLTRERDEARQTLDDYVAFHEACLSAADEHDKAAEARLARAREGLKWAIPFVEAWLERGAVRINPAVMREKLCQLRALADSEPAGRAALAAEE